MSKLTYLNACPQLYRNERAKRHLNLMIYNVPESFSEDGLARKKHDIDFVTKMCHHTQFDTKAYNLSVSCPFLAVL